jgi:hypothetical protein
MTLSPLYLLAILTLALAFAPASAQTPRNYRYSVINQNGQVFSMTLQPVTVSPAGRSLRPKATTHPTASGQRVLGSSLRTAGVYDPAGPGFPLSGAAEVPANARAVGVTIHYN